MLEITKKQLFGILAGIVAIVILFMIPRLGEDVKNEKIVINQYPFTGTMAYWVQPGFQWQLFGQTTEYFKTNQVWFNEINDSSEGNLDINHLENPAFPITYADKGKGYVLGSVRIEMPLDREHLNLIQQHYGSEIRLINELIKPTVGKVILGCGPLMTSLESVSERRNDLIYHATDQLNNGIYATRVKTIERLNTITNLLEKVQQAEIVIDENGNPKRNENSPFEFYGLKVSQLSIADLKYEKATNDQISKQRAADMEIITAKAEAAKAIQQTIKIEEEGKQAAADAKWKQEAIKAKEVTEAEQRFEVARYAAKTAEQEALKIKAEGDATAYANRALVSAGLTPLEKATIEKDTKIGVAEALSKINLPRIVSAGGGGSGNNPMDIMGLKMMLDIVNKVAD
jgi:regulator of protease activity HflC (stomatin/prohibitin superfamily)